MKLIKVVLFIFAAAQFSAIASAEPISVVAEPELGYRMLDPTTEINRKQLVLLESRQSGLLKKNAVHISGAVTAIANYQESNVNDKFGYLMRHPTANNQVGSTVSEATIHSVQLALTGTFGDWVTAYAEMLYDPEQSFGSGTNTDLNRNQVQVRKAYVLLGNLEESPYYASLGKMAIPFGLTDTVNPFTASTVWHAFGGLANGVTLGYLTDSVNISLMGVQGGAQFRAANSPVDGTNVPSSLNNFAFDANYTLDTGENSELLMGASYQRASAYCQDFPITHFSECSDNNPAYDAYAQFSTENWVYKAEWAETTKKWPGTANPTLPQFGPSDVTSFDVGVKHRTEVKGKPADISLEFSRFDAGPDGAEWEDQDQYVLGYASYIQPTVKLFAEYIRTEGFAPLNFLSGGVGGVPAAQISDASAHSDVFMIGVNAAF